MNDLENNILITGIPRSGTSYLCTQLHNLKDCVAINEPEEIFRILPDPKDIPAMHNYYAQLRTAIISGSPIFNKISNGKLIEDTALAFAEESYRPKVSAAQFVLATKNTLGYLARLSYLLEAMPRATFMACVRNPFDTIASWKTTFWHLSAATVKDFRLGFLGDSRLSAASNARLQKIEDESRLEVRRALLWSHLAQIILDHRERITILRYEDLVSDPESKLREIFSNMPYALDFSPLIPFTASSIRSKREALNELDRSAILEYTQVTASQFGYDLEKGEVTL